jgi:hypothetical protein
MFTRTIIPLVAVFCQLFASSLCAQKLDSRQIYFLEDYQYFKPMIANLRTSQNHIRTYLADAVAFSNSTSDGIHWFFDPGFGGYFPFVGWTFASVDDESVPLRNPGLALFLDGSAHLLLDVHTVSFDVMNTDYRIGGGLAMRVPRASFLSVRLRIFHESTHIGDEYTLHASRQPGFRRYNVSYEAGEAFLAIDHHEVWDEAIKPPGLNKPLISYLRAYAGVRRQDKLSYDGFTGTFETSEQVTLASKNDYQFGAEIYFRGWLPPEKRPSASGCSKFFAFQHLVLAADFNRENKYSIDNPSRIWSTNIVLGLVYGENFGLTKKGTVRWQLNYYSGVNPHGQFRTERVSYLGLDYIIDI